MIIAIIGLSSLLAYESGAGFGSSASIPRAPSVAGGYYVSGNNLTVVTYAYDSHGLPVNGLDLNVSFQNVIEAGTSNTEGFANFTFSYNITGSPEVSYNFTYTLFGFRQHTTKSVLTYVTPGLDYSGYSLMPAVFSPGNNSNLGFIVMYVGSNGSPAPQTNLYLAQSASKTTGEPSTDVYDNHSISYNVTDLTAKAFFPVLGAGQYNETFDLAIMSNGSFISQKAFPLGRLSIYTPMTQTGLQALVLSGIGSILGLLIPILGVFAGYLTYGKDKTTGVLESVMKRPVTRGGLITSRFIANSVSIIASVIVSMVIGDLIIHYYFHLYLSTYFALFFIWTYIVEGLAFLGLVYMFSHLVRSQGALLGITIAIFVVLGLFWAIIPAVVMLALGIGASSHLYLPLNLAFNFASPSGYSNLVSFFFTNSVGTIATITANPAAYGINEFTLLLSGFLWVAIPFVVAFYLAMRMD